MRVYIASPYLRGDKEENVMRQINTFHALTVNGFIPYAPLLGHYIDQHYSMACEWWLEFDLNWVEVCDCVLRLDGRSDGADREVEHAKKLNIPVYYSLNELLNENSKH